MGLLPADEAYHDLQATVSQDPLTLEGVLTISQVWQFNHSLQVAACYYILDLVDGMVWMVWWCGRWGIWSSPSLWPLLCSPHIFTKLMCDQMDVTDMVIAQRQAMQAHVELQEEKAHVEALLQARRKWPNASTLLHTLHTMIYKWFLNVLVFTLSPHFQSAILLCFELCSPCLYSGSTSWSHASL